MRKTIILAIIMTYSIYVQAEKRLFCQGKKYECTVFDSPDKIYKKVNFDLLKKTITINFDIADFVDGDNYSLTLSCTALDFVNQYTGLFAIWNQDAELKLTVKRQGEKDVFSSTEIINKCIYNKNKINPITRTQEDCERIAVYYYNKNSGINFTVSCEYTNIYTSLSSWPW